jgi:small subunit ribosomal protein S16
MLRIRLSRTGKKGQPSYRVVVTDIRNKRDGRIVENIGNYYPLEKGVSYKIVEARALHWLNVGAQPSDAVRRLLEKQGTFERLQRMRGGETLAVLAAEIDGAVDETAVAEAAAVVIAEVEEEE